MGFFKKVFKGIKKVVKKVAKGIKKVFKKVAGVFGKLGIVGQLGLMFLGVPPIIKDFFAGLAGGIGNFVSTLGQSNTVFGRAMSAIHSAGSTVYNGVKNAFTTVSDAISNGIDRAGNFLKGEGFTLSEGRTSVFDRFKSKDPIMEKSLELNKQMQEDLTAKIDKKITEDLSGKLPETEIKVSEFPTGSDKIYGGETTVTAQMPDDLVPDVTDTFGKTTKDKSLLSRMGDYVQEGYEGVVETLSDPKALVSESLEAGIKSGIGSKVAYTVAGDPPTQMHLDMTPFMMPVGNERRVLSENDFKIFDNEYLQAGSVFGAKSYVAAPYFSSIAEPDSTSRFHRTIRELRGF